MKASAAVGWLGERALIIMNGVLLLVLCGFMFRPGGQGYTVVSGWARQRRLHRTIEQDWASLVNVTSRVDSGASEVLVVEFADYQCPFCAQSEPAIEAFLAENPHVGIVYRHFPLRAIHSGADGAARASICAEQQGRFRAMHRRLFGSNEWQSQQDWLKEAQSAGVPDLVAFRACLASPTTTARLAADESLAVRLEVRGTPTFVSLSGVRTGAVSKGDILEFLGVRVASAQRRSATVQ